MDTIEFVQYVKMYTIMEQRFSDWLTEVLEEKGWSYADLARKAGVTRGAIGNLVRGQRQPGPAILQAIAGALNLPPDNVYRAAGLLPEITVDESDLEKFREILSHLTPAERDEYAQIGWVRINAKRENELRQSMDGDKK